MKSTKEYDAFGPWILEINEENPMPRLFVPYYKQRQTPLMLFKIPRNIERRQANPSMDLYDSVVALFDTYLYFMQRNDGNVLEYTIAYPDIEAIRYSHELLLGEIYFYMPKQIITIRYNTVSSKIIEKMAALLAEKAVLKKNAAYDMAPLPYSINTIEFLYANLISSIQRLEPSAKFVAYQPPATVKRKLGILRFLKIPMDMQSTAFIVNPAEIIIIERLKHFLFLKKPDYSYSFLRLPYNSIKNTRLVDDEDDENLNLMQIATANHEFSFVFEKGNVRLNTLYRRMGGAAAGV